MSQRRKGKSARAVVTEFRGAPQRHPGTPSAPDIPFLLMREPRAGTVNLTNRQLSYLRGLGQRLKPALHLGREGHTDATGRALEELVAHHELLKVRVLPSAPEPARAIAAPAAEEPGAR